MSNHTTTLGNGGQLTLSASDPGLTVNFAGTNPVQWSGPVLAVDRTPPIETEAVYDISKLNIAGTVAQPFYGDVEMVANGEINLVVENGVHLSHGTLDLSRHGDTFTLEGSSVVTNGSRLEIGAGRVFADPTVIGGNLTVSSGSTADFEGPLQGNGTISIDQSSVVDAQAAVAGLRFNDSGMLTLNSHVVTGPFLATIHEKAAGVVDILQGPGFANVGAATEAVLHQGSDILDLVGAAGTAAPIMSIQFVGDPKLYATPDGHGGVDITTHQMVGSLPTIFTH